MGINRVTIIGLFATLIAVCLCATTTRRGFLALDCNQNITCPSDNLPICCTDGNTYGNDCVLKKENQHRICFDGLFNPIAKVHDGPCNTTTTAP